MICECGAIIQGKCTPEEQLCIAENRHLDSVRVSAVSCFLTSEDRWRRLNDIAPPTAIIATCCVTVARRCGLSTCLISLRARELHDGGV